MTAIIYGRSGLINPDRITRFQSNRPRRLYWELNAALALCCHYGATIWSETMSLKPWRRSRPPLIRKCLLFSLQCHRKRNTFPATKTGSTAHVLGTFGFFAPAIWDRRSISTRAGSGYNSSRWAAWARAKREKFASASSNSLRVSIRSTARPPSDSTAREA